MFSRTSLIATSAAALLAGTAGASAQTACGASYTIAPGDTLYQVAQQCRVGLTRIMELNPGIEPRDLPQGTEIRLVSGDTDDSTDTTGAGQAPGHGGYRVNAGDTLYSIAQTLGVSLFELLRENSDIDPDNLAIGDVIDIPSDDPAAGFRITPQRGPVGTEVTLRAVNLRPGDWVTVGVGPDQAEWRAIDTAQVAPDGEVTTTAAVPDWSTPGEELIFVIDTDRGLTLRSDRFEVARAESPDKGGDADEITLEGRLRAGTECTLLETSDGDLWSVVSDDVALDLGERVRVTGERAEAAYCMQGLGTVDVARLEEIGRD